MGKLVMLIDGLCAFVPSSNRNRMRVILVNATGQGGHGHHVGGCHASGHGRSGFVTPLHYSLAPSCDPSVPPHYPFIRFPRQRRVSRREDESQPLPQVVLNNATEVRFFDWEELRIIRGGACKPFTIADGRRPGTAEPFTPEEARDFTWLPELDKLGCENAAIQPGCLREDPPRNLVLGRIDLVEGEISVDSVVQDSDVNVIWEFGDDQGVEGRGQYSQALAALVRYELDFDEEFITLRFGRFGSDQFVDIRLRPNRRGIIPVEVGNLPLEDALQMSVRPRSFGDSLPHFGLLYGLAQVPLLSRLLPRPVGRARLSAGRDTRGGTTMCLGLTYAGSET